MRSNSTAIDFIILISVCFVLFLPGISARGLWSPDETRYVTVSKEMVDSGDWITLRRNGEIYTQKPPVYFWVVSLFGMIMGGFSEVSARLPSALAGTGTVLITYLLARNLFGTRAALVSGLILSTSLAYLVVSRMVMLDPLFTFLVTASIYLLYIGLSGKGRKRTLSYLASFALMALATLTKGPVGFILPLIAAGGYALSMGKGRDMLDKGAAWGLALFLLIIASWLIPACIRGGEAYTNELLIKQIFGRYLQAFDHKEPFYYYFYAFPLGFLPWIFILPPAALLLAGKRADPRSKFLIIWFSAIFLFFTSSRSKNILYILPLYPAAAIATAYYWEQKLKPLKTIIITVAVVAAVSTSITYFVIPHVDVLKSPKYLAESVNRSVKPGDGLVTFRTNPVYWLYYCGRGSMDELDTNESLDNYLASRERVFCIVDLAVFREYASTGHNRGYLLAYTPYGSKKAFGLISNRMK